MSKELTPLEIIKMWRAQIHWNKDFGWNEELDIIEKALTDYEHFNKLYMPSLKKGYTLEEMEKSLQALEIIKKYVDVSVQEHQGGYYLLVGLVGSDFRYANPISKETYNLLKEVLL